MSLFYPSPKNPLLLKEPTTDVIEFQQQKVNLYLHLAKMYGASFIEVDRQITFIYKKTKVTVRLDVVVYHQDMTPKQSYIFIKPYENKKNTNLIQKYSKIACKKIGIEKENITFLYPVVNENYSY